MLHNTRSLLVLPDELILEIIAYCNVEEAIQIGRAPDVTRSQLIETLSTAELRSKAIRAVRIAHSWRTLGALHVTEESVLHVGTRTLDIDRDANTNHSTWVEPYILSNCKYVLLDNRGQLELWSMVSRRRIWASPSSTENRRDCFSFNFELQEDGDVLVVAATFLNVAWGTCSLCVYKIDFRTGDNGLVIERTVPMTHLIRLMVRGDLIMVHLRLHLKIILLNWRTSSALVLDLSRVTGRRTNIRASLISDHHLIVALYLDTLTLFAYHLSKMEGYWSHSPVFSEWVRSGRAFARGTLSQSEHSNSGAQDVLHFSLADSLCNTNYPPYLLSLHAFQPAWTGKDTLTEIYVVGHDLEQDGTKHLLSYRIQLSRVSGSGASPTDGLSECEASNGTWRLALVSQNRAVAESIPRESSTISNAGRIFSLRENFECYSLFCDMPQPVNMISLASGMLPEGVDACPATVTAEPTSGIIAIGTPGLVRIIQFE
ncbi:hypothetical protein EW145_g6647 [Phellinidium pouzarii]|uniref:F-box domain-containing protein n=1 Tax=Phellinidium pouzarii TaxID=167371 RepID=A0A4S4KWH0_9AGAM|nr:hypothetical protein EW145_g6647 [Phellinidium pouzarii]